MSVSHVDIGIVYEGVAFPLSYGKAVGSFRGNALRDSATPARYADVLEDSYDLPNLFLPAHSLRERRLTTRRHPATIAPLR
jgi:hypothetical protein